MALLIIVLTLLCGTPAAAAHAGLDAARAEYDEGNFQVALRQLAEVEQDPRLTRPELVQLHWWRAANLLALKRTSEADLAFDAVIALEPLHEPSVLDASPVMQAAYARRQAQWRTQHGVTLGTPSLEGGVFKVAIQDHPAEAASATVYARAPGEVSFHPFPLGVQAGLASGVLADEALWVRALDQGALEVVVEASSVAGAVVARMGTTTAPVKVAVDRAAGNQAVTRAREAGAPQKPVKRGLVARIPWLAAAGAVGGGGAAAGVLGLAALLVSALSYGGMWLHPRTVGADAAPGYQVLVSSWVGGGVASGVLALLGVALLAGGGLILLLAAFLA